MIPLNNQQDEPQEFCPECHSDCYDCMDNEFTIQQNCIYCKTFCPYKFTDDDEIEFEEI